MVMRHKLNMMRSSVSTANKSAWRPMHRFEKQTCILWQSVGALAKP